MNIGLEMGSKTMAAYIDAITEYTGLEQHNQVCDWHLCLVTGISTFSHYYLLDMSKGLFRYPRDCSNLIPRNSKYLTHT